MSGEEDIRELYVVSEQLVMAAAIPESDPETDPELDPESESDPESDPEEEPEEDSEEAPEQSLVGELLEKNVELEDEVHELNVLYDTEKDKNKELADRLILASQKISRLEEEKEVIRNHLGNTIQGLEMRIQSLQLDRQAVTNCWRDEMRDRVRSEKRNDELEVEVRSKKAKIDRVNHAFRTAHERFQHRVHHFPREEYRSGHAISRGLVMEMADEEHEDAIRRS